ncbi:MAG: hypothetical protein I8H96_15345 [Sphingomonadaceae bacterium]|nr:hypothetical protein [Sphingomonadaceae bacterium]
MKRTVLALWTLALLASPAGAETIAIPFAPRLNEELIYRIEQHRSLEGRDSHFTATRTLRFEKMADGYRLHATLRSLDVDAAPAAAEPYRVALTPLIGVDLQFRLDDRGKIVALDNMENVWAAVQTGLAKLMNGFAADTPSHRAALAVQALFSGLSLEGRLALLAGEYQPLFLFAGDGVEDGPGRGVRTVAGSPLGRPVPVEGLLRLDRREGGDLLLDEVLAGNGVQLTMRYRLSTTTGLVEEQSRNLNVGGRKLSETRDLRDSGVTPR